MERKTAHDFDQELLGLFDANSGPVLVDYPLGELALPLYGTTMTGGVQYDQADLSAYTRADLAAVACQLNNRPRQTLGWKKPAEVFCLTVAVTG